MPEAKTNNKQQEQSFSDKVFSIPVLGWVLRIGAALLLYIASLVYGIFNPGGIPAETKEAEKGNDSKEQADKKKEEPSRENEKTQEKDDQRKEIPQISKLISPREIAALYTHAAAGDIDLAMLPPLYTFKGEKITITKKPDGKHEISFVKNGEKSIPDSKAKDGEVYTTGINDLGRFIGSIKTVNALYRDDAKESAEFLNTYIDNNKEISQIITDYEKGPGGKGSIIQEAVSDARQGRPGDANTIAARRAVFNLVMLAKAVYAKDKEQELEQSTGETITDMDLDTKPEVIPAPVETAPEQAPAFSLDEYTPEFALLMNGSETHMYLEGMKQLGRYAEALNKGEDAEKAFGLNFHRAEKTYDMLAGKAGVDLNDKKTSKNFYAVCINKDGMDTKQKFKDKYLSEEEKAAVENYRKEIAALSPENLKKLKGYCIFLNKTAVMADMIKENGSPQTINAMIDVMKEYDVLPADIPTEEACRQIMASTEFDNFVSWAGNRYELEQETGEVPENDHRPEAEPDSDITQRQGSEADEQHMDETEQGTATPEPEYENDAVQNAEQASDIEDIDYQNVPDAPTPYDMFLKDDDTREAILTGDAETMGQALNDRTLVLMDNLTEQDKERIKDITAKMSELNAILDSSAMNVPPCVEPIVEIGAGDMDPETRELYRACAEYVAVNAALAQTMEDKGLDADFIELVQYLAAKAEYDGIDVREYMFDAEIAEYEAALESTEKEDNIDISRFGNDGHSTRRAERIKELEEENENVLDEFSKPNIINDIIAMEEYGDDNYRV